MRKFRTLGAWLVAGICLFASATTAWAACSTSVAGTWQVTVAGMTYRTTISPGGGVQSHCPGCAAQTWTCSGNTFTVHGAGGPIVHTISPDGQSMRSGVSSLVRIGGGSTVARKAPAESTRNSSGSSLAPGTTQYSDTTNVPRNTGPKKPPTGLNYHLGNKPIGEQGSAGTGSGSGAQQLQNIPTQGLSAQTRADLQKVSHDRARLQKYIQSLPASQREGAIIYVADVQRVTGRTFVTVADPRECAGMRQRIQPHSPNEAWTRDIMIRAGCHHTGRPLTLRERLRWELTKVQE